MRIQPPPRTVALQAAVPVTGGLSGLRVPAPLSRHLPFLTAPVGSSPGHVQTPPGNQ